MNTHTFSFPPSVFLVLRFPCSEPSHTRIALEDAMHIFPVSYTEVSLAEKIQQSSLFGAFSRQSFQTVSFGTIESITAAARSISSHRQSCVTFCDRKSICLGGVFQLVQQELFGLTLLVCKMKSLRLISFQQSFYQNSSCSAFGLELFRQSLGIWQLFPSMVISAASSRGNFDHFLKRPLCFI